MPVEKKLRTKENAAIKEQLQKITQTLQINQQ